MELKPINIENRLKQIITSYCSLNNFSRVHDGLQDLLKDSPKFNKFVQVFDSLQDLGNLSDSGLVNIPLKKSEISESVSNPGENILNEVENDRNIQ